MKHYLTLVLVLFSTLLCFSCNNKEALSRAMQEVAIQEVFQKDSELGKIRNHASETKPLHIAIEEYVASLNKIDFSKTPLEFEEAFKKHIQAWQDAIPFFAQHSKLRGELHDIFKKIHQTSDSDSKQLKIHEKAIWDTWEAIEQ